VVVTVMLEMRDVEDACAGVELSLIEAEKYGTWMPDFLSQPTTA